MSFAEWAGDVVTRLVKGRRALAVKQHHRRMRRDEKYAESFFLAARLRGYKSAEQTDSTTPWLNACDRSADGEILNDLPTLRNRSRAANRDDALASGIYGTFVRGVVGSGLRPQARTGDDAKNDAMEAVWGDRCDRLALADGNQTHSAHQRLVYGKRCEDGEILLVASSDGVNPLWIESCEAERLCTPSDAMPEDPAGRIVDGVEKDAYGRVVAYWVLKQHPGEQPTHVTKLGPKAQAWISPWPKSNFTRVTPDRACHDRDRVTRPGQTRGVPKCHAIMQDLRDLDLLMLASLKRAQIAACLAVFLTSSADATDLIELTAEDYGYRLDQKLEPGMIFRLYPGESMETASPSATLPDLDILVMILARRIGSAVGLSPQAILRMWESLSYAGARTVKTDDRQTYRVERRDFSCNSLRFEWRVVMEEALLNGDERLVAAGVTNLDIPNVEWIGDEEEWVDPVAESDATKTMLQLGLTTLQIEAGRLGRDWEELVRQKARELELIKKLGLPDPYADPVAAPAEVLPKKQPKGVAA